MTDVTAMYFVIGNAQYDNYKRIIIKSGDDEIGSTIADNDNYEYTIGINNAAIDGDITVEVNPLPGLIYFNNNSSNDDSDYTATFYDSDDNVLATRIGTSAIYTDFDVADVAAVSFSRAEGDYEGIRVMIYAGNYDDGDFVSTELYDESNSVADSLSFTNCKYIRIEYEDY